MTTRGVERAVGGAVAFPRRRPRRLLLLLPLARYVVAPQPLFLQRRATRRGRASSKIALSLARSLPPSLVSQGLPSMYLQMYSLF